ncbi:MAG: serine/threonine-protein kinase, partial [Planctomycetota bacterium]
MMLAQPCDRERILGFLSDDSESVDQVLFEHLEQCSTCREYLDEQTAEAEQWEHARSMLQSCDFDTATVSSFSVGSACTEFTRQPVMAKEVIDRLAPSDDPNRLGRLAGYEVSGVVGVGGMGVVLKAVDPSLDRVVAIKVLSPHLAGSEKARKRFSREARAAAAVLHPNVIPIYSVSKNESLPYLVMAYVRGGSLQKRLDLEGPLAIPELLRIGSQIASGLAAAHEQGLVHRDIKPENIMLEGDVDRIAITDFGLARAVDDTSVTQAGAIAGTPMYMSPEQARGEKVDQKSDLFSLGSVLYALCTGQPPYRADSSYSVMRKVIEESPTPIRELNPEVPQWLASIIDKLMAREKANRYESADDVQKLLEGCLNHVQQPENVPLPEELVKPARLTAKKTITLGILLLAITMIGGYAAGFFVIGSSSIPEDKFASASQTEQEKEGQATAQKQKGAPIEQSVVKDNGADPKSEQLNEFNKQFRWLMEQNPELREEWAAMALAAGNEKDATAILAMEVKKDARAKPTLKLAELLLESNKPNKAVDAFLEAYRRDPTLVDYRHFVHFENTNRMSDLADLMTEDFLGKMGFSMQSEHFMKRLLKNQETRQQGFALLNRIWNAQPNLHWSLLVNLDEEDWAEVESPARFLRQKLMPLDVAAEGAGWKRFTIESTNPTSGDGGGILVSVRSLLLRQKAAETLAAEVEDAVHDHPEWKAGLGLLAVLKARAGQFEEAVENARAMMEDLDSIPSDTAWVFGQALSGMDDILDQEVIRLYEHTLSTRKPEDRILRTTPIGDLAVLYGRAGDRSKARELLQRLAFNKEVERGLTRYPPNEKFYNIQAAVRRFNRLNLPVDALLLLGQVNSGMTDVEGGSAGWVKNNFVLPYRSLKKEAKSALTPEALLEAWDAGLFFVDQDLRKIDMKLNVNVLNSTQSRLDSAVLQVFEACGKNVSEDDTEAVTVLDEVDSRITSLLSENPDNLECAMIAAGMSLYRNDVAGAKTRLQDVQRIISQARYKKNRRAKAALWPIAREALLHPD